jgi:5-methylcytosine-specific restriction enzyme subunit McrC
VLFDMNKVFEDFLVVALRDRLGLSERDFPQGSHRHNLFLDDARRVRIKPDISWWSGTECHFIGDIKYKRVNDEGIEHPDLYQLLSYTIASGLNEGLLVYAAGEGEGASHAVPLAGKTLHVRTLDLSGSDENIMVEVDQLAVLIHGMRSHCVDAA